MALKRLQNGQYVLKSKDEVKRALALSQTLSEEATELQREHGILELMADATELHKAATRYMVDHNMERIEIDKNMHGTLIKAVGSKRWIGTKADLTGDEPAKTKTVRAILKKKFGDGPKGRKQFKSTWNRITKRVVVPEEIDALVAEGVITIEEIAPALVETQKMPYLRVFKG